MENEAKQLWLEYFNNYLFEKGVITEDERNKMCNIICKTCHIDKKKMAV